MTEYGSLPNVSGNDNVITIKALAAQFGLKTKDADLKVSKILRDAGIKPVGKLPSMKDGKPHKGKPSLGFDAAEATKAVEAALAAT